MELPYTICFITKGDSILLLFRNKAPNKGKWNGVGGKIELNEIPYEAILREAWEETGLIIKDLSFRGIVTWNKKGGMYVYTGSDTEGSLLEGPEGKLEWKPLEWIKTSSEVVSNMPYFLPYILTEGKPKEHAFFYSESGGIIDYKVFDLADSLISKAGSQRTEQHSRIVVAK
ncbi:NUDIX hydrolase [Sutcliffiella halmapala]|uniref:NUDIX hydrolase n=1 Tax=Sutcliffiella halmapala TaxID=79882 RepID=UPI0014733A50|nr:8-oxo-dGTP diphosphatase [Sutcliffiella halmapala]